MLQNGGATMTAEVVKDTTTQGFMKDVIEESKHQPVLVDFWAPWCGPCKQLTPVLEKTVKAAKGKVKLAKMNIDEHPAIPGQMGIQSIPAV
ncbi:MAG: thioredoxin domain-containing protein, partial [Pseudolabrys sp.]